jgi:hypothetical protein
MREVMRVLLAVRWAWQDAMPAGERFAGPGGFTGRRRPAKERLAMAVQVRFQTTPNPNAGKFVLDRPAVEGSASRSYYTAAQAAADPVAAALFGVPGVASLFMVDDFITVTKTAEADWQMLGPAVIAAIEQSMP